MPHLFRTHSKLTILFSLLLLALFCSNSFAEPGSRASAKILDLGFSLAGEKNESSIITVAFSGEPQIVLPEKTQNIVRFGLKDTQISQSLRRIVDTSAFPSVVRLITPYPVRKGQSQDVLFAIELRDDSPFKFEALDNKISVEFDNGSFAELEPAGSSKIVEIESQTETETSDIVAGEVDASNNEDLEGSKYSGKKISLTLDNVDIKQVLQLISEVSQLNVVLSDDVKGKVNLRLKDVPWDQALDILLNVKDLGMLQSGNVIQIMPKKKLQDTQKSDLLAQKTIEQLEPLITTAIKISYTDLNNVVGTIQGLLSDRGTVVKDDRNRQLIVNDIASRMDEVRKFITLVDLPERQVEIEARIVEVDSSYSHDLGVALGYNRASSNGNPTNPNNFQIGVGGSYNLAAPSAGGVPGSGLATALTFGRVGIDKNILDAYISAMETEGKGRLVSSPRVTTMNGEKAVISQGTKIPYQTLTEDGPKTEFVDAALSLTVTPTINHDGTVILEVIATNSSPGSTVSTGAGSAPAINTKEAETKVLVKDNETTVIGGIFIESTDKSEVGVPVLKDIPVLGYLFKSNTKTTAKSELLIFISPKIMPAPNEVETTTAVN